MSRIEEIEDELTPHDTEWAKAQMLKGLAIVESRTSNIGEVVVWRIQNGVIQTRRGNKWKEWINHEIADFNLEERLVAWSGWDKPTDRFEIWVGPSKKSKKT